MAQSPRPLAPGEKSRVIEMAWEERTPIEAIEVTRRIIEQADALGFNRMVSA